MDKISATDIIKKENCKKAEFYIKKYLAEVAVHFNLTNSEINKILYKIFRKKDTSKKWWQFFQKSI